MNEIKKSNSSKHSNLSKTKNNSTSKTVGKFHLNYKTPTQKMAWGAFDLHDVIFLSGPAGVGKSHLAVCYAIHEILQKNKSRIIITRPIVESGESLGYLPGDLHEKVTPYMAPMYDCMRRIVGEEGPQRDMINASLEVCPLAYMRGRTFDNAICIFDEAQNANMLQLKMFLTRFGENSKVIITGDPRQSDISGNCAFSEVMSKLESVQGISVINFGTDCIVRHPLVGKIIEKLEE